MGFNVCFLFKSEGILYRDASNSNNWNSFRNWDIENKLNSGLQE